MQKFMEITSAFRMKVVHEVDEALITLPQPLLVAASIHTVSWSCGMGTGNEAVFGVMCACGIFYYASFLLFLD